MSIRVAFDHPANAEVLAHLRSHARPGAAESASPGEVEDPYYNLGTHPDLVEWFWDRLPEKTRGKCKWIVHGWPVLVHPGSGILFGFAGGTHTYALRLPPDLARDLVAKGAKRTHAYPDGSTLDLGVIGPGWILGGWNQEEKDWCATAHEAAGDA